MPQLGTPTSTEVLAALAELAEAQWAQAPALSSYQTAIVDLVSRRG